MEEYDENSPPKKPKVSRRKLRFNKRSFSLPKREAKRLFTSLMIIDTQIEHENSSSLRSRSDNGTIRSRNLFNSKGGRSIADEDDRQSNYSQNSSYYNFENMRSNLRRINRDSVFSKSSERS